MLEKDIGSAARLGVCDRAPLASCWAQGQGKGILTLAAGALSGDFSDLDMMLAPLEAPGETNRLLGLVEPMAGAGFDRETGLLWANVERTGDVL
jgi:hypothetical protein